MSYLVLARKWRPTRFDDVVGQRHITHTLQNAIRHERVPHALLFIGSRGIGKTSCARIFAKALNCLSAPQPIPVPCDECASCQSVNQGNAVDVFEIDGASNNGVEQVRELRESTRFSPSLSRFKIYIIDEVHMLSVGAFNALLKTLEEPPPHVKFIFATTEPHKIPDTIISRCQRFDFKRIQSNDIVDALERICTAEGVNAERTALDHVAREAQGGMRDSLSLLDQLISFCGDEVTEQKTREVLGLTSRELLLQLVTALYRQDAAELLTLLHQHGETGADLKRLGAELLSLIRDLMVIKVHPEPQKVLSLPPSELNMMITAADPLQVGALHQTFDTLARRADDLQRSAHPKLILEMTLLQMCHQADTGTLNEVMEGLLKLEHHLNDVGLTEGLPPLSPPPSYRPVSPYHHQIVSPPASQPHRSTQEQDPPVGKDGPGFPEAQPTAIAAVPTSKSADLEADRTSSIPLASPPQAQAQAQAQPQPQPQPQAQPDSSPKREIIDDIHPEEASNVDFNQDVSGSSYSPSPSLRLGDRPRHPRLPANPHHTPIHGDGVDDVVYEWLSHFNRWLSNQDSFFAADMRVRMRIITLHISDQHGELTLGGPQEMLNTLRDREEVVIDQLLSCAPLYPLTPISSLTLDYLSLEEHQEHERLESLSDYGKRQLAIRALHQVDAATHEEYVQHHITALGGEVIFVVPEALQNTH